jgi:hypothetical protein
MRLFFFSLFFVADFDFINVCCAVLPGFSLWALRSARAWLPAVIIFTLTMMVCSLQSDVLICFGSLILNQF